MGFHIKQTRNKEEHIYRTLYLKKNLYEEIDKIAKENKTSWNNVVVSMIESCLEDEE